MSFRVFIDNYQIFGNDENPTEWVEFLKTQNVKFENGNYEGTINDVKGMFEVIDKIARKEINERHAEVESGKLNWKDEPYRELTDFSRSIMLNDSTPLLEFARYIIDNSYVFLPYNVYMIIKDKLERDNSYMKDGIVWIFGSYKLKDGEKIYVEGH